MKKTAVITGIAGMVGSHLTDFLIKNTQWNVVGFLRWNDSLDNIAHLFPMINSGDRVKLFFGDLNDQSSLQKCFYDHKPDFIFHLAAQSYPQTSFVAPIETLDTNILGTAKLLEAVKYSDLDPVVHVCASSEIFGRVPKEYIPINEETPMHPASPYAISKAATDLLGRYYAEAHSMKVITTRMFTHTGPRRGDVFAESTFSKQIAMIEKGLIPPVIKVGNLDSLRTWADVRDAVRAYYMLVTLNPTPGEYYNIGGQFSCTIGEMLDYLISCSSRKDIEIEIDPERLRPIDADLQVPDTTKFTNHTGWKPQISFETTMKDLLDYWRSRVNNSGEFLTR